MSSTAAIPPVAVIGAGSWGTALAMHIAKDGRKVYLWGHEPEQMKTLAANRSNEQFLPGLVFPESLEVIVELSDLPQSCIQFLVVVPSHAFRPSLAICIASAVPHDPAPITATGDVAAVEFIYGSGLVRFLL